MGCSSDSKDAAPPTQEEEDGGIPLKARCEPGSVENCSSYVTPTTDGNGILTEFGPYGAVMEINKGAGYEIEPAANDTKAFCETFANIFGEDPALTAQVLDLRDTDLRLYTVFRPVKWKAGEKYPIITWGNGTCAQPGAYAAVLMHVASHGFVVVAANGRFVANGAQVKALDFMFAANDDPASEYYQRLDTSKVGAMGHSQGSGATVAAANDERVDDVILFNGGQKAGKPFLAISGDRDINNPTVDMYRTGTNDSPKGAFLFYHQIPQTGGTLTGHLTVMMQPDRVTDATTGWWKYVLNGDKTSRDMFVGSSCGLCGKDAEFEFGAKCLD